MTPNNHSPRRRPITRAALLAAGALAAGLLVAPGEPVLPEVAAQEQSVNAPGKSDDAPRPTVAEARRQAELLHSAMHSTLQLVHHRYYREDEGLPLPAATLKEVFAEIEAERGVALRWLAVEGQPMNSDHVAKTSFELAAEKALKSGAKAHEQAERGVYQRAGAITLSNHCLKCHVPDRTNTKDRTAGLIIAIPVASE